MPIYPPRTEPIKKQEELTKRENELVHAINRNVTTDKLLRLVDKYRKAKLSMLKAKTHQAKEYEFQKKQNNISLEKIEELIIEWREKSSDDIISEVKKTHT